MSFEVSTCSRPGNSGTSGRPPVATRMCRAVMRLDVPSPSGVEIDLDGVRVQQPRAPEEHFDAAA